MIGEEGGEGFSRLALPLEPSVGEPVTSVVHSPYFQTAVDYFQRTDADALEQQRLVECLTAIDQQSVDNLILFESEKYPGVKFPITTIDVEKIPPMLSFAQRPPETPDAVATPIQHEDYVLFTAWAYPPDGHPWTAQDMVYDRVISELVKASKPNSSVRVHVVGYPNCLWGQLTPEWVEGLKKTGFAQYGEALSDYVNQIASESNDGRIILQTMSMGSPITQAVVDRLPDQTKPRARVLHDNPAGIYPGIKGFEMLAGFIGEGGIRKLEAKTKQIGRAGTEFYQQMKTVLAARQIEAIDDPEQLKLKKKAGLTDAKNAIKGTELDTSEVRTFIRKGILDPTTFSPLDLFRYISQSVMGKSYTLNNVDDRDDDQIGNPRYHKSLQIAHRSFHNINRFRAKKWRRMLLRVSSLPKERDQTDIEL
ncbi:hypothetical protein A3H78_00890 [Candidatus Roizmanbacteria bacterium RIFCSPLOWO2_02_FULL_36_11]|uniref:Uncharacterized protein n=1 Tax=Candidatus Roizmanbacteria bacterium RIFCSPLOWO2_02_FULL_36_11 TaxID=1802071 RepID=A0A1F7JHD9_9BACT|nr:MAG: hypothetical protein A3H78_00890 [Candidatus Roizmanbacteria bacterium RIFCSPLOWO2_02_FULL_36_11]